MLLRVSIAEKKAHTDIIGTPPALHPRAVALTWTAPAAGVNLRPAIRLALRLDRKPSKPRSLPLKRKRAGRASRARHTAISSTYRRALQREGRKEGRTRGPKSHDSADTVLDAICHIDVSLDRLVDPNLP